MILVRAWQESDRPFLRTIYLHARRDAWPWLNGAEWQLEDFDAAILDEEVWVAEQDGHRLGFASVWANDNFLHNLFVDPQYQSLGVGMCCWNRCRKRLPVRVRLSVWSRMRVLLRFTSDTAGTSRRRVILRTESII